MRYIVKPVHEAFHDGGSLAGKPPKTRSLKGFLTRKATFIFQASFQGCSPRLLTGGLSTREDPDGGFLNSYTRLSIGGSLIGEQTIEHSEGLRS